MYSDEGDREPLCH